MAEFGSHHFTSHSGSKPSIFSILAQDNLAAGLRDAFRHFCKVLTENFPDKFQTLFLNFEELYTLMDFVFNCIHFRIKGASFSEHFYDMKRIPDPRMMSRKKLFLWVSVMSLSPYLRIQGENLFRKIREKEEDGSLSNDFSGDVKKMALLYKKIYPSLHFLWEFVILCYYVAYALNKSTYHSPFLHIISSQLQTCTHDGNVIADQCEKSSQYGKIHAIIWKLLKSMVETVTVGVSVGAFFLQFLDWWYSTEGRTSILPSTPVPPPPPKWPCNIAPDICPLCHKVRTNDTALRCSGFVFCYPCIFKHVTENRCCPVTRYPASIDELVRIFQQNE